jgi:hypothetical protein
MKCTVAVMLWIKLNAEAENFTRFRCIDSDAPTVSRFTSFQIMASGGQRGLADVTSAPSFIQRLGESRVDLSLDGPAMAILMMGKMSLSEALTWRARAGQARRVAAPASLRRLKGSHKTRISLSGALPPPSRQPAENAVCGRALDDFRIAYGAGALGVPQRHKGGEILRHGPDLYV